MGVCKRISDKWRLVTVLDLSRPATVDNLGIISKRGLPLSILSFDNYLANHEPRSYFVESSFLCFTTYVVELVSNN